MECCGARMRYWLEGALYLVCQTCDYVALVPVETVHCPLLSPAGVEGYHSLHEADGELSRRD
jgi:hypothetical protein